MEKAEFVEFLNALFVPIGFKRKGNNWVINGKEINKIINLQKSQYSNSYYLNYSYIINSLPLNGFRSHLDFRLTSFDKDEREGIRELLNFENEIDDAVRVVNLSKFIDDQIINQMRSVYTEKDLFEVLKGMKYRHTVPPFVLDYFDLTPEG